MGNEYKTLLNLTRLLYELHEAGRPKPFNLFSVLRSSHDEVNLHSRFLAALLDHRNNLSESREDLKDFVETVLKIDGQLDCTKATVERERDHIDILITFGTQHAIVIENKIYHADEERQLYRYWDTVKNKGFKEIYLVYLTLDGRNPSNNSIDSLKTSDPESYQRLNCIGYDSTDFQGWLTSCQQRASSEPELRESIVQYLRLVRELTDTDTEKEEYMEALKKLLKQGDNLVMANELSNAALDLMIDLQNDFWEKLKEKAETKTGMEFVYYCRDNPREDLKKDIHRYYTQNGSWYGIRGHLSKKLALMVEISIEYGLVWGIENYPRGPQDLKWKEVERAEENFKLDQDNIHHFAMQEEDRRKYAQEIVDSLSNMCKDV